LSKDRGGKNFALSRGMSEIAEELVDIISLRIFHAFEMAMRRAPGKELSGFPPKE
jgi:hypothetical protein